MDGGVHGGLIGREVSRDGFAAYRCPNGKEGVVKGVCFGYRVMFRRKCLPNRMSKLISLCDGVCLGMRAMSDQ